LPKSSFQRTLLRALHACAHSSPLPTHPAWIQVEPHAAFMTVIPIRQCAIRPLPLPS
jgi:hypothetical protein